MIANGNKQSNKKMKEELHLSEHKFFSNNTGTVKTLINFFMSFSCKNTSAIKVGGIFYFYIEIQFSK